MSNQPRLTRKQELIQIWIKAQSESEQRVNRYSKFTGFKVNQNLLNEVRDRPAGETP